MPIDDLDRALIHALHLDGRVPFSTVATVLGVSQQTIARRYRRLRADGVLRVAGMTDARRLGLVEWFVRLRCTPDAALKVAEALAARADTAWVRLTSGGTEIVCVTRASSTPDALLLRQLPRTPRVTSVSAHCLLRRFVGGPVGWLGRAEGLTPAQRTRLTPPAAPPATEPADVSGDGPLLAALRRDGRATYTELAEATGLGEATVRRRVDQLRGSGVLYLDLELDNAALGFHSQALLWLSVPQARLERTAESLARHREIAFVAATTGPTNLLANVICRDVSALYTYLADRIGTVEAIGPVESAPVIRTLKRAG